MSSASASASSRYCVVSSTVVPSRDELADHVPELAARRQGRGRSSARRGRSPAGRRSGWPRGRAAGACRPSSSLTRRSPASAIPKRSSSSPARPRADGRREAVEPADQLEVRPAGEQPVDRRRLRGDADAGADLRRGRDDVVARDRRRALGRRRERRQQADRGRLSRAVVAEQAEHRARRDVEIELRAAPRARRSACRGPGLDRRRRRKPSSRTSYA